MSQRVCTTHRSSVQVEEGLCRGEQKEGIEEGKNEEKNKGKRHRGRRALG